MIGETIGEKVDQSRLDVGEHYKSAKQRLDLDITKVTDEIKRFDEELAKTSLSEETRKYYEKLRNLKQGELDGLNDEVKKLDAWKNLIEERDKLADEVNTFTKKIQALKQEQGLQETIEAKAAYQELIDVMESEKESKTSQMIKKTAEARFEGERIGEGPGLDIDIKGDWSVLSKDIMKLTKDELKEQFDFAKSELEKKTTGKTLDRVIGGVADARRKAYMDMSKDEQSQFREMHKIGKKEFILKDTERLQKQEELELFKQAIEQKMQMAVKTGTITSEAANQLLGSVGSTLKVVKTESGLGLLNESKRWGGGVNPDEPYLVGEVGPELMIPAGRGNIVSAEETVKMMGGYVNTLSGQNAQAGMTGGGLPGGFLNAPVTTDASTIIHNYPQQPQPNFGFPLPGDDRYNVVKISA